MTIHTFAPKAAIKAVFGAESDLHVDQQPVSKPLQAELAAAGLEPDQYMEVDFAKSRAAGTERTNQDVMAALAWPISPGEPKSVSIFMLQLAGWVVSTPVKVPAALLVGTVSNRHEVADRHRLDELEGQSVCIKD